MATFIPIARFYKNILHNLTSNKAILSTLAYFDLFDYPLSQSELYLFAPVNIDPEEFTSSLEQLTQEAWVYKLGDFYSLQDDHALIERRKKGNAEARKMMLQAEKIAAFLSSFPFVRGVAVSGSLSKNFADEGSDIDFFIITKKNRLWLARTLMHVYKKFTFLTGRQHLYCMNYYVDEAMMEIKEKNTYTAIEVATLIPMRGIQAFQQFFERNNWNRDFLPNHTMKISYVQRDSKNILKTATEFLLQNPLGSALDILLMKLTKYKWERKRLKRQLNRQGHVLSMDAGRHYSKPDPFIFQHKLMSRYEQKLYLIFRKLEGLASFY